MLKAKIIELKARLAQYENAHTPPSHRRCGNRKKDKGNKGKYEERLPHRKVECTLNRMHGLKISPATIFDFTRRAAEAVQPEYDAILNKIRGAPILYVDETGIHVLGEKHWIWTFTTPS